MEVPDRTAAPSPVPTPADVMSNPGAETSGLRSEVSRAGPSDVKSVITSLKPNTNDGVSYKIALTVTSLYTWLASFGLIVLKITPPSLPEIMTTKIIISSPFNPKPNKKPPNSDTKITTLAPATWALNTLVKPEQ